MIGKRKRNFAHKNPPQYDTGEECNMNDLLFSLARYFTSFSAMLPHSFQNRSARSTHASKPSSLCGYCA